MSAERSHGRRGKSGLFVLAILGSVALRPAAASDAPTAYLCAADRATGFAYDTQEDFWASVRFKTQDKFLVRETMDGDRQDTGAVPVTPLAIDQPWAVFKVGEPLARAVCPKPDMTCAGTADWCNHHEADTLGTLSCRGRVELHLNRRTLRFQAYYLGGYLAQDQAADPKTPSTPSMEIGSCSPVSPQIRPETPKPRDDRDSAHH